MSQQLGPLELVGDRWAAAHRLGAPEWLSEAVAWLAALDVRSKWAVADGGLNAIIEGLRT